MPAAPSRKPRRTASKSQDAAPRTRRTQQERTAESTQRLTEAAIELIAEKGFNNTTTAEIGERAGYSRSMVQFRYGTKEALLESLLREEWETRLLITPDPDQTGIERVLGQVDLLRDQVDDKPALMRGFFVLCYEALGPLQNLRPWLADWLARYTAATEAAIRSGIEDGTIRPDADPAREAGGLIADCIGQTFRWIATPDAIDFVAEMNAVHERVEARLAAPRRSRRARAS
jgi:AcrR family transcriptional regulator